MLACDRGVADDDVADVVPVVVAAADDVVADIVPVNACDRGVDVVVPVVVADDDVVADVVPVADDDDAHTGRCPRRDRACFESCKKRFYLQLPS